jgi:hypothetical protein
MYKLISLQTIKDSRGSLVISKNISFDIKRVFFVSDVPENAQRGGHAHYKLEEILVPVKGEFTVNLYTPDSKVSIKMSDSSTGILLYPFMWRTITNYSKDAVCLSFCSEPFDEQDYIKSWDDYKLNFKKVKDDYLLASF